MGATHPFCFGYLKRNDSALHQNCFDVIARSVLCDEAIPRRSSWPGKQEIASPKNGSQ
jgi:hypothetical protein